MQSASSHLNGYVLAASWATSPPWRSVSPPCPLEQRRHQTRFDGPGPRSRVLPRTRINEDGVRTILDRHRHASGFRVVPSALSLSRKGDDRKWRADQLVCIDKLPATRLETLKMAMRFLVLHRDRSIRLVTEGLGSKPFHGRIVMLVNEHTLSAGEMVAAFANENGLAKIVGTRTGGQVLGGGKLIAIT